MHFGLTNVYVVHKDGNKFHLTPLPIDSSEAKMIVCFGENKHVTLQGNIRGLTGKNIDNNDVKLIFESVLFID